MKIFRHLLGITKLDKEKNQCIRDKTGAQNIVKEIKQYHEKVAKTRTDDGHKQTTNTSTTISTKRTKEHRTTEEEMEGPTSSCGLSNRKQAYRVIIIIIIIITFMRDIYNYISENIFS